MPSLAEDKEKCCGCGACLVACPKGAISLVADSFGSKYPRVDYDVCVECGRCVKSCAYVNYGTRHPMAAFAAFNLDVEQERRSASGGVFSCLAHSFIDSGGVVAGAVERCSDAEGLYVVHDLADSHESVCKMQGSKYVQSETSDCYSGVLSALRSGSKVLFSGTPCQVAAVKRLAKDDGNLYTIDLICHGVPPSAVFNDYCKVLGGMLHGSVTSFRFREKDGGSGSGSHYVAGITLVSRGRKRLLRIPARFLSYYKHFLGAVTYRDCCYSCPYAQIDRVSDITIGDYWGVEKAHVSEVASGEIDPSLSWSCILVNSEKGAELLERHGRSLKFVPSTPEKVAAENRQLSQPSSKPFEREGFLRDYVSGGYKRVEKSFRKAQGGSLRFYKRLIAYLIRQR